MERGPGLVKRSQLEGPYVQKYLSVAFAYVGVIIGAGLASGQDLLQYFLSFGAKGLIGIAVLGVLNVVFGVVALQLGSYYRSGHHDEVFERITHPALRRVIDVVLVFSGFAMGFVMLAGAGANFEQQFGLPVWAGSALCAVLVILTAFLDFDRIMKVIGVFTPMIIVAITILTIYSLATPHPGAAQPVALHDQLLRAVRRQRHRDGLRAWRLGAAHRRGPTRRAHRRHHHRLRDRRRRPVPVPEHGSRLGRERSRPRDRALDPSGLRLRLHADYFCAHLQHGLLAVLLDGAPLLGRGDHPHAHRPRRRRRRELRGLAHGFKKLIGGMYPIIGWLGVALLVVLAVGWMRERSAVLREENRRRKLIRVLVRKHADDLEYTDEHRAQARTLAQASVVDGTELRREADSIAEQIADTQDDAAAYAREALPVDEALVAQAIEADRANG